MFVEWKKMRLGAWNDRKDPECVHNGEGRWTWTPLVMESYAAPSGPRRRTVLRPGPELRSCCMDDPVVRVRWWNAIADALLAADGIDRNAVVSELIKRVPLPTQEEEALVMQWPHDAPWRQQRRIDVAAAHRRRVAREVLRLVLDELHHGPSDWENALTAWDKAETAYARGSWTTYEDLEMEGLDLAGRAIAKVRGHSPQAEVGVWLDAFNEHVRRLVERRARREEDEARRRRTEEERRCRADADEAQRRAHRRSGASTEPRSAVDRINDGFVTDWAALLGVTFPCTHEALKRAHRDAALRHHPDLGGDPEMMKAVNIAKTRLEAELTRYWATCSAN